ncbi:MAG TPA: ABC transporter permease [Planctomycetota bacterium]|jgi:inositol transport system permease protein
MLETSTLPSPLPVAGPRFSLARLAPVLALVMVSAVLALRNENFLTGPNLVNIVRGISINGILAVGVTYVMLTGGVDLSLGSMVALTGVAAALFAHPDTYPVALPIAIGLLMGAVCGLTNGWLVAKAGVAPFIATLGMMAVARGLALVFSKGKPVSNLSRSFCALGEDCLSVPVPIVILFAVAIVSYVFLTRTRYGRYIYAVGGNEAAAHASGLHVTGIKLLAYTLCGVLSGLAGIIQAARIQTGQPNAGVAYELDAIAAAVIGGTSLSGGVGSIGGTILGALLMGVINNGLDLENVSPYYQQIVKGAIIVGAVWIDRRFNRR